MGGHVVELSQPLSSSDIDSTAARYFVFLFFVFVLTTLDLAVVAILTLANQALKLPIVLMAHTFLGNCDGKQSYYPATSAGWAPLFNPSSASTNWQKTVAQLTAKPAQPGQVQRIVSPAASQNPELVIHSCMRAHTRRHLCHRFRTTLGSLRRLTYALDARRGFLVC
jgi:hypothetical protein